jgi:hypothetical protein
MLSPIMWRSEMHKTTALYTAEADYYTAWAAGVQVRNLLERLAFAQRDPTQVVEDNTACIEWGNDVIGVCTWWARASQSSGETTSLVDASVVCIQ